MPRVDGITVVESIKKKTSMFKNPAFIILSAVGGEQMTEILLRQVPIIF